MLKIRVRQGGVVGEVLKGDRVRDRSDKIELSQKRLMSKIFDRDST